MDAVKLEQLKRTATMIRMGILEAVHAAASGHPGGSLSSADIMTYLYFSEMKVDVNNPKWSDRDRFVLSKGHAAPVLYSTLANKGFFPVEDLKTLRHADSYLQGHPDMKHIPGVDMTTGSLGQGISAAVGMALAAKIDGPVASIVNPAPYEGKLAAFGYHVITIDAHDYDQIEAAFTEAKTVKGQPTAIVANSVKGKGVSFMENQVKWHGAAPNDEQYEQAMAELRAQL